MHKGYGDKPKRGKRRVSGFKKLAKYTKKEGKKKFGKVEKAGDRCYYCGDHVYEADRKTKGISRNQKYIFTKTLNCKCGAIYNMESSKLYLK
jgi:uncharacterized protein with PIN domain